MTAGLSPPRPDSRPPDAWRAFWQSVFRFQSSKFLPWIAVRNTIGVALPLALGVALNAIPAGLAVGTGALNVAYSDSDEPYAKRGRRMLAASVLVGLAVFTGSCFGRNSLLIVTICTCWAFAAGLLVAVSTVAADLGVISLVTLLVYAAVPQTPERAVYAGLLAFCGGLLQAVLALLFWPIRRYAPERRVLGNLFLELSRAMAGPVQVVDAPPASAESTAAQNALSTLDRSVDGERYRALLSQGERLRLSLLVLTRLRTRMTRENASSPEVQTLERFFAICSQLLRLIASQLLRAQPIPAASQHLTELNGLAETMREERAASPEFAALRSDARIQMDAIIGQLHTALELSAYATPAGLKAFEQQESRRFWTLRLSDPVAILRSNLNLKSSSFRHAVRMAVCVAIGDAFARGFELPRAYWLPMTIALVLKPDFTATFSRGVLRVAGTYMGLLLTTELFHALPPAKFTEVALIALFMFIMRCFGPANYGVFVIAITGLIVLMLSLAGVAPAGVMAARGLNTALGGAVALLAYWVWPTWERTQAAEALAQMLDAYREYFRLVRDSYLRPGEITARELDRARVRGRLARTTLEASMERLSAEPGTKPDRVHLLAAILASTHRMVHAFMALEVGLGASPVPTRPEFRVFARDTELTLYYLAAALRGSELGKLPDLREDHHALVHAGDPTMERYALSNTEADRITNSLNTLSTEVRVWLGIAVPTV